MCARWSADGQCTANPQLMATNCARTCNLCQPPPAITAALQTSQQSTGDGINATSTLKHLASSPESTQTHAYLVYNSSVLSSVSSIGVDATRSRDVIDHVTTRSGLKITDAARQTTSSLSLLSLMMTAASQRHVTADVTQSVTSSYTGITSSRPASHSSVASVSGSDRTAGDRVNISATESSVTTALLTWSNDTSTRSSITDTQDVGVAGSTAQHTFDAINTTTTLKHLASSPVSTQTLSPVYLVFNSSLLTSILSVGVGSTLSAAPVSRHVTSLTDVTSAAAAAAEKVSSEGLVTSSSRELPTVTSYTDTVVDLVSSPVTTDDDDVTSRPHATPARPHTRTTSESLSSRHTSVGSRHSVSVSDVQLSSVDRTTTSSIAKSSISSISRKVDLTSVISFANVTPASTDASVAAGTRWSHDNTSLSVTSTSLPVSSASTESTPRPHSVADDDTTVTRDAVSGLPDTPVTRLQPASSEQTTKPRQFLTSTLHNTLLSSDGTLVESTSSLSSASERSSVHVTERVKSSSPSQLNTTQVTGYSSSPLTSDRSFSNDSTVPVPFSTILSFTNDSILQVTSSSIDSSTNNFTLPIPSSATHLSTNDSTLPITISSSRLSSNDSTYPIPSPATHSFTNDSTLPVTTLSTGSSINNSTVPIPSSSTHSSGNDSTLPITPSSTLNSSYVSTQQTRRLTTATSSSSSAVTLYSSNNVTSSPVFEHSLSTPSSSIHHVTSSQVTSASFSPAEGSPVDHVSDAITESSSTANDSHVSRFTIPSFNTSGGPSTEWLVDHFTEASSTADVNVTKYFSQIPSTLNSSSSNVTGVYDIFMTLPAESPSQAVNNVSTSSQLYISEPIKSATASDGANSFSTPPVATSAAAAAAETARSTRSRPLWSTTSSIVSTTGRRRRVSTGTSSPDRLRSHAGHVVNHTASFTVDHPARR